MLEIELADGSGRLDLFPKEGIPFEQSFNLYDFEHIEGTKSWSFKLPKTANNVKNCGWINVSNLRTDFKNSYRVNVYLFGDLWKIGLLYFLEDYPTYWSVHFAGEAGLLKQLFDDKELVDFSFPKITSIADTYAHAKLAAEEGPSEHPYTFAEVYIPNAQNDGLIPSYLNPNKYNFSTGIWEGFISNVGGGFAPLCPFPYVKQVLEVIGNELGVHFAGELWNDTEFERLVFFNTQCLNTLVDDVPEGAPVDSIDVNNHVPKVKVTDLLINICQFFNQLIEYDDTVGTITFISRKTVFSSTLVNDFRYKISSSRRLYKEKRDFSLKYEYLQEDLDVAKYFGTLSDLTGINGGAAATELNVKFSTIPTLDYGYPYDTVPVSSLEINAENPYQFLFFRGFKLAPEIFSAPNIPEVPYVSCDLNYTPAPGYTLDKYALTWKGTNGLHETWWAEFLSVLRLGRVLEVELVLNAKDLLTFQYLKRHSLMEDVVIFEEMKATIKNEQLKVKGQVLKF